MAGAMPTVCGRLYSADFKGDRAKTMADQFPYLVSYIVALIGTLFIQVMTVGRVIKNAVPTSAITAAAPDGQEEFWLNLITKDPSAGAAIGMVETWLLFSILCYGGDAAGVMVAAYFAFKVASKWEVWSHVYRVPESLKDVEEGPKDLDYLLLRTRWGAYLFSRFVIGTVLNLLIALFGAWLYGGILQSILAQTG